MTPQAQAVLILWLPIAIFIFRSLPVKKAVIYATIAGTLFLPRRVVFPLLILPDYQSSNAVVYGLLLGILIYDSKWITKINFWWLDIPVFVCCFSSLMASLTNGLGFYDGVTESLVRVWIFLLPYLFGRIYLTTIEDLRKLCIAIIQGALIYVPFCIWEGLMSPQLHRIIYGYFAHSSGIRQQIRYGGYRPIVFMEHGLLVGFWFMLATLIAVWLWQSRTIKYIWGIKISYIVFLLMFMLIWCRSTAALAYFLFSLGIIACAKWGKLNWPLFLLIVALVSYISLAALGLFDKQPLLEFFGNFFPSDRIQSLEFRLDNEEILGDKAREKFWFGWGGWGRSRVLEENFAGIFEDVSVTDSVWIILFGTSGIVAVISLIAFILLPSYLCNFVFYPVKTWFHPKIAPVAVLGAFLTIWMLDLLVNSTIQPLYPMIIGGITSVMLNPEQAWQRLLSQSSTTLKLSSPSILANR